MLRPRLRISRVGSLLRRPATPLQGQFRSIHAVPNLGQFPRPEDGVPGLLSGDGFDIAWTQYMDFVVEKLNALTAGTDFEHKEPLQILKETARQPRDAPTFNYASMAHNNAFFFEQLACLNEDPANPEAGLRPVPVPEKLRLDLERDFSSMETLRREMLVTADVMFGPGFVWLVKMGRQSQFRILTTYLAGTPYTAAHWRRQGADMNNHGGGLADGVAREFLDRTQVGVGAGHVGRFDNSASAPGGSEVIPLLCINTWEHVWLRDWGIGAGGIGGKRAFAAAWWECIDWDKVYNLAYPSPTFK